MKKFVSSGQNVKKPRNCLYFFKKNVKKHYKISVFFKKK